MLGEYQLTEVIGEGATSIVMKATKTKGGHRGTYALKIFFTESADDSQQMLENIQAEVDIYRKMRQRHPGILRPLEAEINTSLRSENGEKTTVSFITFQLATHGDLGKILPVKTKTEVGGVSRPLVMYYGLKLIDAI